MRRALFLGAILCIASGFGPLACDSGEGSSSGGNGGSGASTGGTGGSGGTTSGASTGTPSGTASGTSTGLCDSGDPPDPDCGCTSWDYIYDCQCDCAGTPVVQEVWNASCEQLDDPYFCDGVAGGGGAGGDGGGVVMATDCVTLSGGKICGP